MGCTSSKLDDLPAVALCRERCGFLEAAIQQRYVLAESHVAYTHSLRGIGHSLHLFINHHHRFVASGGANGGGDSPRLNLPPQRKGDPEEEEDEGNSPKKTKLPSSHHHKNHVLSGSESDSGHLEFDSDSEDDDDDDDEEDHLDLDSDSLHHHSPQHHNLGGPMGYMEQQDFTRYPNPEMMGQGGSYMHMNYMMNKSMPPSVIYEQRPISPQRVYVGESSSSSSNYPYNPYPPNSYFGYSNPESGFYGSSTAAAASKPPPPPPSPPRSNGWDFLNPFDTYYPPYTPSRDLREQREEEGIPELEDDDSHYEVVKEVHGKPKFSAGVNQQNPAAVHREDTPSPPSPADRSGANTSGGNADASMYQSRPSVSVEKEGMKYEVHVVEKKVVEDAGNEERRSNATATRGNGGGGGGGPRAVPEVAKEIENQFVKAAESGSEIAKLLEVGKHPYGRKHGNDFDFV